MIHQRYTARIRFDDEIVRVISGNEINKLMAQLLQYLENEGSTAMGEIIETDTGVILHQCRKQAPE